MSRSLLYKDLPEEIHQWPALPLSLNGDEVIPLDYRAGYTGWLLYGTGINKQLLNLFQCKLGCAIVIVTAWYYGAYQIIRLAGKLPRKAKLLANLFGIDVAEVTDSPNLRLPGLLVMDMDSTIIQTECIDEIAKRTGAGKQIRQITEEVIRGDLEFSTGLIQRVALLKGLPVDTLQQVKLEMSYTSGFSMLVKSLQELNWHVAIISGGFSYFADEIKEAFNLSAAIANQLEIKGNVLTGKIIEPIVDAKFKAKALRRLAEKFNIPVSQTVAIGSSTNDMIMLRTAGLGIVFNGKTKLMLQADISITHADLCGVMCILSNSLQNDERSC